MAPKKNSISTTEQIVSIGDVYEIINSFSSWHIPPGTQTVATHHHSVTELMSPMKKQIEMSISFSLWFFHSGIASFANGIWKRVLFWRVKQQQTINHDFLRRCPPSDGHQEHGKMEWSLRFCFSSWVFNRIAVWWGENKALKCGMSEQDFFTASKSGWEID